MMANFTLENPCLRARITDKGACLLGLEALNPSKHILRPWTKDEWSPEASAMFPMLPFANRIAGNQFSVRNKRYFLPAQPFNNPYYLHGNGWLEQWEADFKNGSTITLRSNPEKMGIYEYIAEITYSLINNVFKAEMLITHTGEEPAPYGAGFHPFFMLTPDDTVQFSSTGYWTEDVNHLADEWHETIPLDRDFSRPITPSGVWINNCYSGWNGVAKISNSQRSIVMTSAAPLLMVYQNNNANFICLEPQTHQVNAHHLPGRPGLRMLNKNDTLLLTMEILFISSK
jgi:aldose 1-epimerase